ncbi:MAG: ergothioneine biosynthesis protein EgtB [Cyanobacteria bacterium]|nr:ergothioneine biosynthesis protein EgtB [Cyanobacteriota bacterium]
MGSPEPQRGLVHPAQPSASRASLADLESRYRRVRHRSEALIAPLEPEDLGLQGMADASPPKWHLGHTAWFFEEFLLRPALEGNGGGSDAAQPACDSPKRSPLAYEPADPRWRYLFNSYYDAVGARHPRPERGLLSRPPIDAVLVWRHRIDAAIRQLLAAAATERPAADNRLLELVELGLEHEQQHQELLLMDLLDGFSRNPLEPVYDEGSEGPEAIFERAWRSVHGSGSEERLGERQAQGPADGAGPRASQESRPAGGGWRHHHGGLVAIGHAGGGFHFDNEAPRHQVWLEPFALAERLVTNAAYADFIADGGYRRPELWMSEGWAVLQQRGWQAPRYWRGDDLFTHAGRRRRDPLAPVRHLSWFEAVAYARWAGARLPSEAEWETLAAAGALEQAHGVLWQWTGSPYRPYPGFRPAAGAVGEYNGKFMTSQFVLRGGGFLTPEGHAGAERLTYRNFFPPASRWMASGLRLARELP